ncbi:MAG TPA: hypothetical protein VH415_07760 [Nitrososphaeraceae archaeon]
MNIAEGKEDYDVVAKTCGCKNTKRKVTYSFIDSYYAICRDSEHIIFSEIQACQRLLKYASDENGITVLQKEIRELKLVLGFLQ